MIQAVLRNKELASPSRYGIDPALLLSAVVVNGVIWYAQERFTPLLLNPLCGHFDIRLSLAQESSHREKLLMSAHFCQGQAFQKGLRVQLIVHTRALLAYF